MNPTRSLDRKTFVSTLGIAGLALGLLGTVAGSASNTMAQDAATPAPVQDDSVP